MTSSLDPLARIMYRDHRPWLLRDTTRAKFTSLYRQLEKVQPERELHYKVDFPAALGAKRSYYRALISNSILNSIKTQDKLIADSHDENERKYHLYVLLEDELPQYFDGLHRIIQEGGYFPRLYVPRDGQVPQGAEADEAYILDYLKHELIRLYLEVSHHHSAHLKRPPYGHDELYAHYFQVVPPEPQVIQALTHQQK